MLQGGNQIDDSLIVTTLCLLPDKDDLNQGNKDPPRNVMDWYGSNLSISSGQPNALRWALTFQSFPAPCSRVSFRVTSLKFCLANLDPSAYASGILVVMRRIALGLRLYVPISFPEAAILLVSEKDRGLCERDWDCANTTQKDTHTRINTGACRSAMTSKPIYCKITVRVQNRT